MVNPVQTAASTTHHELHVAYVHPDDFTLIEHAAALQHLPIDEFVLLAAFRTARNMVSEIEVESLLRRTCTGSQSRTAHTHGCSLAQGCTQRAKSSQTHPSLA
jgi:hypothetical protein